MPGVYLNDRKTKLYTTCCNVEITRAEKCPVCNEVIEPRTQRDRFDAAMRKSMEQQNE